MTDGHLSFCKQCKKEQFHNYRNNNQEKFKEFEKTRSNNPKRISKRNEVTKRRRKEVENLNKCHSAVKYAIDRGKLVRPDNCQYCNGTNKIEAHHKDYNKPLEVTWLCCNCHRLLHSGKFEDAKAIREFVDNLCPKL